MQVGVVLDRAKKITYGDPMDLKTDLGTVVNTEAAELFDKRVSMAEEEGALGLDIVVTSISLPHSGHSNSDLPRS